MFPSFFAFTFALFFMEQLSKILNKAEELFFRVGIKSITMDDIARELGMSKKTVYLSVDNKKDLVEKVMQRYIEKETSFFQDMPVSQMNAIDIIVEIIKHVHQSLGNVPLSAIHDLQKYYPKSWKIFSGFKTKYIYESMEAIIKKGKEEKIFRANINEKLIAKFYLISIEASLNPINFPSNEFNFKETYIEYVIYHLHGLVSDEGKKYLKTIKLNHE